MGVIDIAFNIFQDAMVRVQGTIEYIICLPRASRLVVMLKTKVPLLLPITGGPSL